MGAFKKSGFRTQALSVSSSGRDQFRVSFLNEAFLYMAGGVVAVIATVIVTLIVAVILRRAGSFLGLVLHTMEIAWEAWPSHQAHSYLVFATMIARTRLRRTLS